MTLRTARRGTVALGAAALATSLLLVPTAAGAVAETVLAPAGPVASEGSTESCAVTDGTLSWGVKERFRSYISGSIANGEWQTTDGASYERPNFTWVDASGEFNPNDGTGKVSFAGTVHFTGHDGLLDLILSNPTVEFDGDGKAALLIDAKSTDMQGKVTVDKQQVWFADLTAPASVQPESDKLAVTEMPAVLTNSGADAFAGFYEPAEDLDPVSVSLSFENCVSSGAATPEPTTDGAQPGEAAGEASPAPGTEQQGGGTEIPWLPIGIGAVALLVIGVTVGMLVGGRQRRDPAAASSGETSSDAADEPPTAP